MGRERRVVEGLDLRADPLERGLGRLEGPGEVEAVGVGQLAVGGVDGRDRVRIGGQRGDAQERVGVAAGRDRAELDQQPIGLARELLVGAGEGVDDLDEAPPLAIEADQAAVEQVLRLLAADPGVLARVGPRRLPLDRPSVEARQQPLADVAGPGLLEPGEAIGDRGPARVRQRVAERHRGAGALRLGGDRLGPSREHAPAQARDQGEPARDPGELAPARARIEAQLGQQRGHVRPALARLGIEAADQRPANHGRDRAVARGLAQAALVDGEHQRVEVVARVRPLGVERLPHGHAEAELIGPGVDLPLAAVLLGGHERRGPERRPGRGHPLRERVAGSAPARAARGWAGLGRGRGQGRPVDEDLGELARDRVRAGRAGPRGEPLGHVGARPLVVRAPGEAEVGDPDGAVAPEQDVGRLEVAVDQPGRVGGREPLPGRDEALANLLPRVRLALGSGVDPALEAAAVDELHGHEHPLAVGPDVVDGDDVGVAELGHRLGLAQESALALGRGHGPGAAREQQLDGDLAVELGIVGGVDLPHAADAEPLEHDVAADLVAADERARLARAERGLARGRPSVPRRRGRGRADLDSLTDLGSEQRVGVGRHHGGMLPHPGQRARTSFFRPGPRKSVNRPIPTIPSSPTPLTQAA